MGNTLKHKINDGLIIVPNELLRTKLSAKAKGLYAHIASIVAVGGRISASVLADRSTDGITSIESGLRELEAAGWLRRSKKKDSKGHFYSVYELKNN